MGDRSFGDFVKNNTRKRLRVFANGGGNMKTNRFSLAVLIGRDIDLIGNFCKIFDLFNDGCMIFGDAVLWNKGLIVDLNAKTALGRSRICPFEATTV